MAQYQEDTQSNVDSGPSPMKKMGKGPEQTLLKGGHTEGIQKYERMLNITSHEKDTN